MNDLKIRELILMIMDKALEKTENTKADVFVDFQAHVKMLDIRIFQNGWTKGSPIISKSAYLDEDGAIEVLREMHELINSL